MRVTNDLDARAVATLASFEMTPTRLATASKPLLLKLQSELLMGNEWGVWEVDPAHISGRHIHRSQRVYEACHALPQNNDVDAATYDSTWCELLRVVISGRLWCGPKGRRTVFSTSHTNIRMLGLVTRRIALREGPGFWSRVRRDEVEEWLGNQGRHYFVLLHRLADMGAIGDAPVGRTKPRGQVGPRDRTGEPEHSAKITTEVQWQPLPDALSAAAGHRAISMVELGPTLLDAVESAYACAAGSRDGLRVARNTVIAGWDWRSEAGVSLTSLPFATDFRGKGQVGHFSWPPRTYAQALCALSVLQTSHLWLTGLAIGGRHGEIAALVEDCVRRVESEAPTAQIHTWKLEGIVGRKHEAPLPSVVVTALNQQRRLTKFLKMAGHVNGDHLWSKISNRMGEPLIDFGTALKAFVATFQLEPLLDGGSVHMHRFRKTLVRMVALALVHAPKVLMEILGHRDEQMTVMRYILSDPGLLGEIQETVRELIVLKGVEAIQHKDELQGKAADVLRERVATYTKRLGSNALDPQNVLEFARAMTEAGTGWAVIAPGIVCTGFTKGGLCNKGQGDANPEYCSSECHNHLAMREFNEDGYKISSAITHAIQTIDFLISRLREAEAEGEDLLIAQFSGQIKAMLGRWKEVDSRFADHPIVRKHIPNVVVVS